MTIITVRDFRKCGVCPDAKHWFAKNDLDWRDFVKNGIDAEILKSKNDSLDIINRLEQAAIMRKEINHG